MIPHCRRKPENGTYATTAVVSEGGAVMWVVDEVAWGRLDVAAILP